MQFGIDFKPMKNVFKLDSNVFKSLPKKIGSVLEAFFETFWKRFGSVLEAFRKRFGSVMNTFEYTLEAFFGSVWKRFFLEAF
jgi:hypothetical protein